MSSDVPHVSTPQDDVTIWKLGSPVGGVLLHGPLQVRLREVVVLRLAVRLRAPVERLHIHGLQVEHLGRGLDGAVPVAEPERGRGLVQVDARLQRLGRLLLLVRE